MNTAIQRLLVVLGLGVVLGGANWTVQQREQLIAQGAPLLLELAPADPRSLMQGDYMRLRFVLGRSIWPAAGIGMPDDARPPDGFAVVRRDANGVGTFVRIHDGAPLAADEALIRYRLRNHEVRIVTNAWFFQEGAAQEFARARYGEFRVAPDGEALLVAMRDKDLKVLGQAGKK